LLVDRDVERGGSGEVVESRRKGGERDVQIPLVLFWPCSRSVSARSGRRGPVSVEQAGVGEHEPLGRIDVDGHAVTLLDPVCGSGTFLF
jgi:hypothetical protein